MDRNIARQQALVTKHRRIRKRITGTGARPRLSIYRSGLHIYGALIDDVTGRTIVGVSSLSRDLRDGMMNKAPREKARLVGEHLAEKAMAAGIRCVVFDRGGRKYTGRVAELADGARSKGLQF